MAKKTEKKPITTERRMFELHMAMMVHTEILKEVIDLLVKKDLKRATKRLDVAVKKLEAVSLRHAVSMGYKPKK